MSHSRTWASAFREYLMWCFEDERRRRLALRKYLSDFRAREELRRRKLASAVELTVSQIRSFHA